jgi:hypothetical protein
MDAGEASSGAGECLAFAEGGFVENTGCYPRIEAAEGEGECPIGLEDAVGQGSGFRCSEVEERSGARVWGLVSMGETRLLSRRDSEVTP